MSNESLITRGRSKMVNFFLNNTDYERILFIDADVRFFSNTTIRDAVYALEQKDLDLVGLNAKCYDNDMRAKIGFSLFNFINNIMN